MLLETFINNKLFTFNDEIHKYNTRIKSSTHLYQSTTSAGLRSVSHKTVVLGNELPLTLSLKRIRSSTAFKCNIRKYLLSLYWKYIFICYTCIFKFKTISWSLL